MSNWPVTCSNCGQAVPEDSGTPFEERQPCENCQSLARTVHVSVSDVALAADATLTVGADVRAEAEVATAEALAMDAEVQSVDKTVQPPEVAPELLERTWLLKTEPLTTDPEGAYRCSLMNDAGDVLADGIGNDPVSGLIDIVRHMLPPDHPDYLPPQH